MNAEDIGIVYNELRIRRILFSKSVPGRRRSESELLALQVIEKASGRISDLEEFLTTQGLKLIVIDLQTLGVAGDGVAYVVVRDVYNPPPAHICGDQIVRSLGDLRRTDESAEDLAVWGVYLTVLLLYFLYTRDERPIEAISGYRDSYIDQAEYLDELLRRIDVLRSIPASEDDGRRESIRQILTGFSEDRLEGRVASYFRRMEGLGVLERIDAGAVRADGEAQQAFRQTLWSAVDMAENFRHYAPHLTVEDDAEQVLAIGSGEQAVFDEAEDGDWEEDSYVTDKPN